MSGIIGFDYPGVLAALSFLAIPPSPELFEQIQIMERAAIEALREVKK